MATMRRTLPFTSAIGAIATGGSLVILVGFAIVLAEANLAVRGFAIVAAIISVLVLATMALVGLQALRRTGNDRESGMAGWGGKSFLLAAGILSSLWSGMTLTTLIWISCTNHSILPQTTLGSSTMALVAAAFALWAISSISQCLWFYDQTSRSRVIDQVAQPPYTDIEAPQPAASEKPIIPNPSISSPSKPSLHVASTRKRSGSDTMSSLRSSLSIAVRPLSKRQITAHRPPSLDSGTGERELTEPDSFDSWDTSSVDPAWQTAISTSPSASSPIHSLSFTTQLQSRVLETIPGSPTASTRSPSPGHPLDLAPPALYGKRRSRSRSHSPATSMSHSTIRSPSPAGPESHIHPLFRSDSPDPPPLLTAGSILTAAPNAGTIIGDIVSIRKMRSGSLGAPSLHASSPLAASASASTRSCSGASAERDSYGSEESEGVEGNGSARGRTKELLLEERKMTPPIPDWVLGAGHRGSLVGYQKRKEGAGTAE